MSSMCRFGKGALSRIDLALGLKILYLDLIYMGWVICSKGDGICVWLCMGLD